MVPVEVSGGIWYKCSRQKESMFYCISGKMSKLELRKNTGWLIYTVIHILRPYIIGMITVRAFKQPV